MSRGWRTKEATLLARMINDAGGSTELSGEGHLKVTGPGGIAYVVSAPHGVEWKVTLKTIREQTGLAIGPERPVKNAGKDRKLKAKPAGKEKTVRKGTITRWRPGDTSGFITDEDGESWFVSWDDIPPGLEQLPMYASVQFSGTGRLAPGKAYPRAYTVRLVQE